MLVRVLLLSAASGAAALIYEIVWFQLLELAIGSTAVSLAVLLATFMGGMCAGSLLFPRFVSQDRAPLRVYAVIELAIGALGLLVVLILPIAGRVYIESSGGSLLLRGLVAAACLLPPTFLMGATLPALARASSNLGLIYAVNITGAVAGCLLAGFYLLRVHDTSVATYAAAALNFLAAVWGGLTTRGGSATRPTATVPSSPSVLVTIAISGACALASEVIWTRQLGLLFGASVYTLSIILGVFLTGLGLGSAIGTMLPRPREALGWCQILAAAAIAWTAYNLTASLPYWPVNPAIETGVAFHFQLDLARALWALLPPTILWGASFPLAVAAAGKGDAAKLMSTIYASNTLGAIIGALAASLVLTEWLGSQHAQQLLIVLSASSGLVLLYRRWITVPIVIILCGLLIRSVPPVSGLLIAYGRYAATWAGKSDIVYAKEGRNSSVAVASFPEGIFTFHVAGKVQASNVTRDMRLQRMLGHLTTLVPAEPRSVLVIGCGAGITAGAAALDSRVEHVTIAEIEKLVPEAAARYFAEPNFDVLRNPKVKLRIDDGRHYLLTSRDRFDAITVDPLDPWVKGAANLYTREFYESARARLNPGGVITMYVQLFATNLDAVKSATATFFEVFPHGVIFGNTYEGKGHDMLLLGSAEPLRIDLDEMERRYLPLADSLAEVEMYSPTELFANYAGRAADLAGWLRGAAINRDRNLRMQYLAGWGKDLDEAAAIYAEMRPFRRFPADVFLGSESRLDSLKRALERAP